MAYLSIWSYKGHVRYLRESKSYLYYPHATSKNEIHICSNKHETGLVYCFIICFREKFSRASAEIRVCTRTGIQLYCLIICFREKSSRASAEIRVCTRTGVQLYSLQDHSGRGH